jgi:hypothetical protein
MEKVDKKQKHRGNKNKKKEMQRNNQKEMLEIKSTVKNVSCEITCRMDPAGKRIREVKDRSIETSQCDIQREKLMD